MNRHGLLSAARALRIALDLHALTLLVAAFLIGWTAEACELVDGTAYCDRSWWRTLGWWVAGLVSAPVPYFLGQFVWAAASRLDDL